MKIPFSKGHRWQLRGWLVLLPTALIGATVLIFSSGPATALTATRDLLHQVQFQEEQPLCQSCHPEAYEAWQGTPHAQATLGSEFQQRLAVSHNQQDCLACHTTGFSMGSGSFLGEGVTCEACHGAYMEGHPAAETMQLPMASDTCRICHLSTFTEWEMSGHAQNNIECYDCHEAHDQGLRTGSVDAQGEGCHSERQLEFAHATHSIEGLTCATCHMSDQTIVDSPMSGLKVRNHDFVVASDVCAGCHQKTIHTVSLTPDP